jgi:DNA-binding HxlR family transcriptional regulator
MARSTSYGQFCPVARAAELFAERWTPLVLRELLAGSTRFNELRRGVPQMSPSLLSTRLKTLQRHELVTRHEDDSGTTEYRLTDAGRALRPVVEQLGVWGQRWLRSRLDETELDVGLLMWDIRRRIDLEALPEDQTVVGFTYDDAPRAMTRWWLVMDRDHVDLCLKQHGFETDLEVETDIRTMTRVWLGHLSFSEALRRRSLVLEGPRDLCRRFPDWLQLSVFAGAAPETG